MYLKFCKKCTHASIFIICNNLKNNNIATNVLESNFEDEIANVASSLQMFSEVIKSQITILIEIVDN
jgi:hypothetical protein